MGRKSRRAVDFADFSRINAPDLSRSVGVASIVVVLPTSPRRLKLREATSGRLSSNPAGTSAGVSEYCTKSELRPRSGLGEVVLTSSPLEVAATPVIPNVTRKAVATKTLSKPLMP